LQGGEASLQGGEASLQGGEATLQGGEATLQGGKATLQGGEATLQGGKATRMIEISVHFVPSRTGQDQPQSRAGKDPNTTMGGKLDTI
jgi:hypothetical protein